MSEALPRPEEWSDEALADLNDDFCTRPPEDLLAWTAEQFAGQSVLTVSFGGAAGMVLLDLIARRHLPITVLFLDTDLLFPETYALAEAAARRYNIPLIRQHPALTLEEQARHHGPDLYAHNPDECCRIRKVTPLAAALRPYRAWVSGIRRDQTAHRAATQPIQWNTKHGLLKLSPLAAWSEHEVWAYIAAHDVPYNPLLNQGYPSLGCTPCTHPATGTDSRAGRWSGFAKTECGIHT